MNLAVFDIDGTLVALNRVEDACFTEALASVFGFGEIDPDWTRFHDVTASGLVRQLFVERRGRPPRLDELRRFRDAYATLLVERLEPGDGAEIAGAARFVGRLRSHPQWRVAVATGNFLRPALHKLRRVDIPARDVPMATADDGHRRAELVRLAVERAREEYGVRAFAHVVSVGDAPWDLRAARELGMPFVAIGERCGRPSSGSCVLSDYADPEAALLFLSEAVCW